jgi:hypothetical protein
LFDIDAKYGDVEDLATILATLETLAAARAASSGSSEGR